MAFGPPLAVQHCEIFARAGRRAFPPRVCAVARRPATVVTENHIGI